MAKVLSAKRWYRLMPVVFITYSLAYLDRANFSFGSASSMASDLMITPAVSSLLGALFFLGYFFFQVPGAAYAEKRSAKRLVFVSLILWGFLAAATGMLSDPTQLMVVRFLLGVVESFVMPAMLVFLCHWFTKKERSRANTVLILGNPVTVLWMSIVSGYFLHLFGWRLMFIIEGLPSLIWAFILLVVAGGMMYAPYGPFFAFIPEMLPVNVAGGAMALINSFGALGSFVGAFLVGLLNSYTGDYGASYLFMACSLLIASGITYRVFSVKKSTKEGALIANDHDLSARA